MTWDNLMILGPKINLISLYPVQYTVVMFSQLRGGEHPRSRPQGQLRRGLRSQPGRAARLRPVTGGLPRPERTAGGPEGPYRELLYT